MVKNSSASKVILLIRNAYTHDFGGGERMPVELAVELKKLGYLPIVVSRSPKLLSYARSNDIPVIKGWWWSQQNWSGVRLMLFPLYLAWQSLLVVWYVYILMRTKADIVHPQSRDDFIAATLAGKLFRKPVIWTDHADLKYVYRNVPVRYKNPLGKIVYRLSRRVRAVILVSHNEKTHIEENIGGPAPNNYQVIYNGVSSSNVIVASRPDEYKGMVIFAATSRLVTAKGIAELIEAFKTIDSPGSKTRLWLFGEGPEETKFRELASGNEHIVFQGFPNNALSLVAAADIFVHPSYHEGFSISLIEAAKLGLPIIACNVGGNPEIVRNGINGILVPAQDSAALGKAMQTLAADPELRNRYGKAARKTYEDNFVWETIVKDKYVPLYE